MDAGAAKGSLFSRAAFMCNDVLEMSLGTDTVFLHRNDSTVTFVTSHVFAPRSKTFWGPTAEDIAQRRATAQRNSPSGYDEFAAKVESWFGIACDDDRITAYKRRPRSSRNGSDVFRYPQYVASGLVYHFQTGDEGKQVGGTKVFSTSLSVHLNCSQLTGPFLFSAAQPAN